MLNFTVYGFNDTYELSLILNGIRHYMGSSAWSTLAHVVMVIVILLAVLRYRLVERDLLVYLQGIFLPVVLYVIFFATPCKVNLTDEYSHEVQTISSVPFGVGGPLWFASLIEKSFIDAIDTYVAPPNTPKFKEVDYFGQARLMAEVSTTLLWNNPPLQQSLRDYFENCVLPEISSGTIPIQKVKTSADLFALFASANQSLFTPVYSSNSSTIQPCASAYASISGQVASGASSRSSNSPFARGSRIFGSRQGQAALAGASFDAILGALFSGQQDSMEALFTQNLMINTTRSAYGAMSPATLATISEAESSQFTTAVTGALVYIKQLPKLRALFKLVLVAMFPVIGAFFIAQASRPFVYWAGSLLWISLWLPAEAGIHAAYAAIAIADLRGLVASSGGYSLANNMTIVKWATESAALAGTLMVMVPVLTGFLIRWVFPQLGTAISGMLQASRGLERQVTSAAADALSRASERVLGLKHDEFAKAAMDYGETITRAREFSNDFEKGFGGMYQGAFGQRAVSRTSEEFIQQALGGKQTLSLQVSAQDVQQAQQQETSLASQFSSVSRTASAAALLDEMRTGNSSYSASADAVKTYSMAESDKKSVQNVMSMVESTRAESGASKEAVQGLIQSYVLTNDLSGHVGASTSKGFGSPSATPKGKMSDEDIANQVVRDMQSGGSGAINIGASGRVSTSSSDVLSYKDSGGVGHTEGSSLKTDVSLANGTDINRALAEKSTAMLQNSLSFASSEGRKTSDLIAEAQGVRNQYDVAQSRSQQLSSAAAYGATMSVEVTNVFGGIKAGGFSELREASPELRQVINSGANDTQIRKEGAAQFVRDYQRAEKSTDPKDWMPVLRQILGGPHGWQANWRCRYH